MHATTAAIVTVSAAIAYQASSTASGASSIVDAGVHKVARSVAAMDDGDGPAPALRPLRLPPTWQVKVVKPILPPGVKDATSRLASMLGKARPSASGSSSGGPRRARRIMHKPVFAARTGSASAAVAVEGTASRAPRVFYGFCSIPGEGRESLLESSDANSDRVVVVEQFCSQRNQTLALVVDGHGFAGAEVAEFVAAALPDTIASVTTTVRRKRRPHGLAAASTVAQTSSASGADAITAGVAARASDYLRTFNPNLTAVADESAATSEAIRTQAMSKALLHMSAPVLPIVGPVITAALHAESTLRLTHGGTSHGLGERRGVGSLHPHHAGSTGSLEHALTRTRGLASSASATSLSSTSSSAAALAWAARARGHEAVAVAVSELKSPVIRLEERGEQTLRRAFARVHQRLIRSAEALPGAVSAARLDSAGAWDTLDVEREAEMAVDPDGVLTASRTRRTDSIKAGDNLSASGRSATAEVEDDLAAPTPDLDVTCSGASALAVIIREDVVLLAHAGSCRAILGRLLPRRVIEVASHIPQGGTSSVQSHSLGRRRRSSISSSISGMAGVGPAPMAGPSPGITPGSGVSSSGSGGGGLSSFPHWPSLPPAIRAAAKHTDLGAFDRDTRQHMAAASEVQASRVSSAVRSAAASSGALLSPARHGGGGGGRPPRARGPVAETSSDTASMLQEEQAVSVPLTVDHRPDRSDELLRLQALGSRVEYFRFEDGTLGQVPRLFGDKSEGPGLAVSRGLGFADAVPAGVLCDPETTSFRLTPRDRFLILGTDGLWTALSSAEAVAIVHQTLDAILWGGSAGAAALTGGSSKDGRKVAGLRRGAAALGSRPILPPLAFGPSLPGEGSAVGSSTPSSAAAPGSQQLQTQQVPVTARLGEESLTLVSADTGAVTGMGGGPARGLVPARGTAAASTGDLHARGGGIGGAVDHDWDLADLLVEEDVRRARVQRVQRVAAAAAEALCAAAIENLRGRRTRRDDITAVVLILDHPTTTESS